MPLGTRPAVRSERKQALEPTQIQELSDEQAIPEDLIRRLDAHTELALWWLLVHHQDWADDPAEVEILRAHLLGPDRSELAS